MMGKPEKSSSSSSGREYRTHRVSFRLSDSDYRVFCALSRRGGFASLSSFLRYLAYCSLRATGKYGDGIPDGVLRVFRQTYDYDVDVLARAVRLVESARRRGVRFEESDIGEEVAAMFRECEERGAGLMFPGDVNWRK